MNQTLIKEMIQTLIKEMNQKYKRNEIQRQNIKEEN